MFSEKQTTLLRLNLDGRRVKTRQQNNITLSYLEGYDIIDTANLAFGFGGWSYKVKELTQVSEETNQNQNRVIGYKAIVSITVYDPYHKHSILREDIGFGTGIAKEYASAHESGAKEAVTDALKRAFRTFGNQFGNALYDKSMKSVDHATNTQTTQQQLPPSLTQSQQQSASDPYASLYQLGLGVQEQNGEIVVTGSTYGKQQTIKGLGFRWDASRKIWYKQLQEAA